MTETAISQLPDSVDLRNGDLLLISRQSESGWGSCRAALSYLLAWLGVGRAGGVAPLDDNGGLVLNGISALRVDGDGHLILDFDVPTADPGVKNALWTQGGVLLLSAGPIS